MPENGHDGRAGHQIGIFFIGDFLPPKRHFTGFFGFFHHLRFGQRLITEFGGHNRRRIKIDHLINGRHDAVQHQFLDRVNRANPQLLRQVTHTNCNRDFDFFLAHQDLLH